MQTVTLLIAILAAWEILVIWFRGSIFASLRARVECWENRPSQLLRCQLCLAPWVSLAVVLWLGLSEHLTGGTGSPATLRRFLAQSPLIALAVARAANVLDDLARGRSADLEAEELLPPVVEPEGVVAQADAEADHVRNIETREDVSPG